MSNHYAPRDDFSLWTLFSGSSGNAVYLRAGTDAILIDVGCSARTTVEALARAGATPESLGGIFITHEHIDHVRGLPVFSRRCDAPIHAAEGSASYLGCPAARLTVHTPLFSADVGCIHLQSFPTPHDSHMSVGYLIDTPYYKIGLATDLGYLSDELMTALAACDALILESNYDLDLLERGKYPYALKCRIRSDHGHLSNNACAEALGTLTKEKVRHVLLAHLSEENNTPELAWRTSNTALEHCGKEDEVRLAVADRHVPTRLL